MTSVLGVTDGAGAVYLAADGRLTSFNEIISAATSKVFVRSKYKMAFGVCGSIRLQNVLVHEELNFIQGPDDDQSIYNFVSSFIDLAQDLRLLTSDEGVSKLEMGSFMIGYHGSLYVVDTSLAITKCSMPYYAIGSGSSYVLGAMSVLARGAKWRLDPVKIMTKALKISATWDNMTDDRINLVKLEAK